MMSKDVIFIAVPAVKRVHLHLRNVGVAANAAVPLPTLNDMEVDWLLKLLNNASLGQGWPV